MEGNKTKTLFFSEVPDSVWEKIEPKITERYSKGVRTYYSKFGEAYLRKNRPDNDDFYGFSACYKRLVPVVIDFTSDSYKCNVRKDESGFVTITEDGQLLDVFFVDLHYDFLRDLFKMIDFLASKPKKFEDSSAFMIPFAVSKIAYIFFPYLLSNNTLTRLHDSPAFCIFCLN